jgi:hypothetical protein
LVAAVSHPTGQEWNMDAEESHGSSIMSGFDISSGTDRFNTPALLEGFELMEAFSKIKRDKVRQEILALTKRLSSSGA